MKVSKFLTTEYKCNNCANYVGCDVIDVMSIKRAIVIIHKLCGYFFKDDTTAACTTNDNDNGCQSNNIEQKIVWLLDMFMHEIDNSRACGDET